MADGGNQFRKNAVFSSSVTMNQFAGPARRRSRVQQTEADPVALEYALGNAVKLPLDDGILRTANTAFDNEVDVFNGVRVPGFIIYRKRVGLYIGVEGN